MSDWIKHEEYPALYWLHDCGGSVNDETMQYLTDDEAKYCPFCGKKCTYDYYEDEEEE